MAHPYLPGVSRQSSFGRWGVQHKATTRDESTHLLLSGGMIKTEGVEEEEIALKLLAQDIKSGLPNYAVEQRTETFRLCQDYDFVTTNPAGVTMHQFREYLEFVQHIIQTCFPEVEDPYMIVCSAPKAPKESDVKLTRIECGVSGTTQLERQVLTKSGYHTFWPNIYVDRPTAIRLRFILKQAIERKFPNMGVDYQFYSGSHDDPDATFDRLEFDSWDSVLDLTIYVENGLRMLGSHKAIRCKNCKRRIDRSCQDCNGTGYIDKGRPYTIHSVIDRDGQVNQPLTTRLKDDHYEALKLTCLRCVRGEEVTAPFHVPGWFTQEPQVTEEIDKLTNSRKRKRARAPTRARLTADEMQQAEAWGGLGDTRDVMVGRKYITFQNADTNSARARMFEDFCFNHFSPVENREFFYFKKIMIGIDPAKPSIFAVPNVNYCKNVEREHSGQDIYLIYDGRKVYQHCWSSKPRPGRGACTSPDVKRWFRDNGVQLPNNIREMLFPSLREGPTNPTRTLSEPRNHMLPSNRHPSCTQEELRRERHSIYIRQLLEEEMEGTRYRRSFGQDSDDEDIVDMEEIELVYNQRELEEEFSE